MCTCFGHLFFSLYTLVERDNLEAELNNKSESLKALFDKEKESLETENSNLQRKVEVGVMFVLFYDISDSQ